MPVPLPVVDCILPLVSVSLPLVLTCILCLVRRHTASVSHLLLADRQLAVVPVAVSLAVSSISVNMSQDVSTFFMVLLSSNLGMAIIPNLFLTVFHSLQMSSVYEYLELRYSCWLVRRLVSLAVLACSQLYAGVLLLTACTSLAVLTGIPAYPYIVCGMLLPVLVLPCGGVGCVVWAGVWQAGVVVAGITTVLVTAWQDDPQVVVKAVSLAGGVWLPASEEILHTMAVVSGQVILWCAVYGCHQAHTMRYCSTVSAVQARVSLCLSILATCVLSTGVFLASKSIRDRYHHSGQGQAGTGQMDQAMLFFSQQVQSRESHPLLPLTTLPPRFCLQCPV